MADVRILDWREMRRNSLLGFARVELPSGMVIADVTILTGERGPYAMPPSKPMIGRDGTVMKDACNETLLSALLRPRPSAPGWAR